MKKLFLLLLTLLTAWALSTLFIGEKTQSTINSYIKQADKQSKELYDVSIKLISYDKSFLSANAEIEIDIIDPTIRKDIVEFIKLPIKSNLTIIHGPLFFNDGLNIGLAKVSDTIPLSDFIADKHKYEFFKYVNDDIAITSNTKFEFNGNFHNKGIINNIRVNGDDLSLKVSPTIMTVNGNLDSKSINYKSSISIEDITLNTPDNYFNIKEIKFNSNINELFGGFYPLGDSLLKMQEITLRTSETNIPPISLSVSIDSKASKEDNKLLDERKVNISLINHKQIDASIPIDSINITQNFSGFLEEDARSLWNLISVSSTMKVDTLNSELSKWFNTFLSRNSLVYGLKVSTDKNNKHTGNMDLMLSYIGQQYTGSDLEQTFLNFKENRLDLLNADLQLSVHKDWLNTLDQTSLDVANSTLSDLVTQKLIKESPLDYSINASYKSRKAVVNDEDFSEDLANILNN
ncbi:MAG: DUF945 family protein [Thiotrichales bacterium]|jgi:hypothetical protein|nr:DUF945 family protein [Thiotrichales bacterium]MBT3614246.1 DUF945 family protein [Thiotrichales bacterium]MBT3752261.1 DUF945 family protein [Thiotrichales bacterium]MBT3837169.1 DUF945 family protein [Thiotrichales bacterium]MBT4152809.1 DUF945 family protein [Thiotrichales bacterium]